MRLEDFLGSVDLQSECKVVYYDYDKEERKEIFMWDLAMDKRIAFVYVEDNVLYLEVDMDD